MVRRAAFELVSACVQTTERTNNAGGQTVQTYDPLRLP